jgi:hypothetical protein
MGSHPGTDEGEPGQLPEPAVLKLTPELDDLRRTDLDPQPGSSICDAGQDGTPAPGCAAAESAAWAYSRSLRTITGTRYRNLDQLTALPRTPTGPCH